MRWRDWKGVLEKEEEKEEDEGNEKHVEEAEDESAPGTPRRGERSRRSRAQQQRRDNKAFEGAGDAAPECPLIRGAPSCPNISACSRRDRSRQLIPGGDAIRFPDVQQEIQTDTRRAAGNACTVPLHARRFSLRADCSTRT